MLSLVSDKVTTIPLILKTPTLKVILSKQSITSRHRTSNPGNVDVVGAVYPVKYVLSYLLIAAAEEAQQVQEQVDEVQIE